jgi:hypothetical protein
MGNFAPAISMKRRSTRFAAAVMTSGALIAAGLGGASAPATASTDTLVDLNCVQVVSIVCQSLNHNEILTVYTGDILSGNKISILSDNLSHNDLNVENVANILSNNNIKCSTFVLSIAGVTQTKQCTW